MTYRERPSVGGAVVWTAVAEPGEARILPDGCMDLMWDGVDVMIAGPDTAALFRIALLMASVPSRDA